MTAKLWNENNTIKIVFWNFIDSFPNRIKANTQNCTFSVGKVSWGTVRRDRLRISILIKLKLLWIIQLQKYAYLYLYIIAIKLSHKHCLHRVGQPRVIQGTSKEQNLPLNPAVQWQEKCPLKSTQVAPFLQGELEHSLISTSQKGPSYPGTQWQL